MLIEEDLIPDDVVIQVLTQAREELIERTYESLRGAKQAIVHLYNSTSTLQRRVVFGLDEDGILDIAVRGAEICKKYEELVPGTDVFYEYSPESYTGTELEFAVRVCNAVLDVFEPTAERPGHHQPAGDGRDGHAQRVRRLHRVDGPPPAPPRARRSSPCTRTTTGVRRSPRPSSATWPAPTGSRAACSATASAPATSAW